MFKKLLVLISFILLFSSCATKKFSKNVVTKNIKYPVFISMAENSLVFENISPIFYENLFRHYLRLGYKLSTEKESAFNLSVKIKNLSPTENFISRDLLIYNVRVSMLVECKLFDLNNNLIKKKKFELSRLVSIPDDPLNNSSYFDFEYKHLIFNLVVKIEQYFRNYLFEK